MRRELPDCRLGASMISLVSAGRRALETIGDDGSIRQIDYSLAASQSMGTGGSHAVANEVEREEAGDESRRANGNNDGT